MSHVERQAVRFAVAIQNGYKIDWSDGSFYVPEDGEEE